MSNLSLRAAHPRVQGDRLFERPVHLYPGDRNGGFLSLAPIVVYITQ
jgi:hypothetical protein